MYSVRLSRIVAVLFFSLYSGARTCIIPFLTLFFRFAGFSPLQAGFLRGFQTIAVFLIAPLLVHKLTARHLHCSLMSFIFLSVALYLCLLYTPTFRNGIYQSTENNSLSLSSLPNESNILIISTREMTTRNSLIDTELTTKRSNLSTISNGTITVVKISQQIQWTETPSLNIHLISTESPSIKKLQNYKKKFSVFHNYSDFLSKMDNDTGTNYNPLHDNARKSSDFNPLHEKKSTVHSYYSERFRNNNWSYTANSRRKHRPKHKKIRLPRNVEIELRNLTDEYEAFTSNTLEDMETSVKTSLLEDYILNSTKMETSTMSNIESEDNLEWVKQIYPSALFWSICTVAILGEICGGSVEKLTAELWYKFLDEMDYLEKHDQHLIPSSFASALAIFLIGIIHKKYCFTESITECFDINFYVFSFLATISILVSYFFPVCYQQTVIMSDKRRRMVICKMIFGNLHTIIALFVVLVAGIAHACLHDYFLCFLSDIGAGKYTIGVSVLLAMLSDIPMFVLHHKLMKVITLYGCFGLSLIVYCIRFMFCSFIWHPWFLAISQLLHSVSFTVMWRAIDWYVDQISTPGLERNIHAVFSTVYWGIGYAGGTIVSGIIYNKLGPKLLFLLLAAVTFLLFVIFTAFHTCFPKLKPKTYSKLLFQDYQDEDGISYNSVHTDSDHDDDEVLLERVRKGNRLKK